MTTKIYCDYCEKEMAQKAYPIGILINGTDADICDECGTKVSETLQAIKPE